MSYKFYKSLVIVLLAIYLLLVLFSCKTTKEVIKIETRYDSTAIKENKALRRFLSEEIERFEKERESWDKTGVTFFPEGYVVTGTDTTIKNTWTTKTSYPPYTFQPITEVITDSLIKADTSLARRLKEMLGGTTKGWQNVYRPTKILFNEDGKVKSIEGPVKSFNNTISKKEKENSEYQSRIDSMGIELEKAQVEISKKESVVIKEKKVTVMPWWTWFLLAVGWIGRGYWPRIKKYFIPIKL